RTVLQILTNGVQCLSYLSLPGFFLQRIIFTIQNTYCCIYFANHWKRWKTTTYSKHQTQFMTEGQKSIPKWILIVSALFALMELIVSLQIYFSPQSVLAIVDLNAQGVDYLILMWVSRQFALGFILAFATFKKSIPMLTIAYIFLLVMFIGDFFIGISQQESALIIGAIVMCIISSAMIFVLNRRN
nr:hypothetical protein [Chitinophagales bacterium]